MLAYRWIRPYLKLIPKQPSQILKKTKNKWNHTQLWLQTKLSFYCLSRYVCLQRFYKRHFVWSSISQAIKTERKPLRVPRLARIHLFCTCKLSKRCSTSIPIKPSDSFSSSKEKLIKYLQRFLKCVNFIHLFFLISLTCCTYSIHTLWLALLSNKTISNIYFRSSLKYF